MASRTSSKAKKTARVRKEPKQTNFLPAPLKFYLRPGMDVPESVADVSLIPRFLLGESVSGSDEFVEAPRQRNLGCNIRVAIFSTKREARAYFNGFQFGNDADAMSAATEAIKVKGGSIHAFIVHDSDCPDEELSVIDYRGIVVN